VTVDEIPLERRNKRCGMRHHLQIALGLLLFAPVMALHLRIPISDKLSIPINVRCHLKIPKHLNDLACHLQVRPDHPPDSPLFFVLQLFLLLSSENINVRCPNSYRPQTPKPMGPQRGIRFNKKGKLWVYSQ